LGSCRGQHFAFSVQQIELGAGLIQHQAAKEVDELLGETLLHGHQVGVLHHHPLEEGIGPVVRGFVVKALKGHQHRGHHANGGQQSGQKNRESNLGANGHCRGASRIL
jgi:hypothetical protein